MVKYSCVVVYPLIVCYLGDRHMCTISQLQDGPHTVTITRNYPCSVHVKLYSVSSHCVTTKKPARFGKKAPSNREFFGFLISIYETCTVLNSCCRILCSVLCRHELCMHITSPIQLLMWFLNNAHRKPRNLYSIGTYAASHESVEL